MNRLWVLLLSFSILVLGLGGGLYTLRHTHHAFIGQLHPPHDDVRTLHVKPHREFIQTLVAEGDTVDSVLFFVASPMSPSVGQLRVLLEDDTHRQTSGVVTTQATFPDGQLFVAFDPPLVTHQGAMLTMRITASSDVNLQYQIDGSKYAAGELVLFTDQDGKTKEVPGDLAFQVSYHTSAIQFSGLTPVRVGFIAVAALAVWCLFVWLAGSNGSLVLISSPLWERTDLLTAGAALLVVGAVYGSVLFFHPLWWSTNRDYIKDVLYLSSTAEALKAPVLPAWEMNMCGGQPLMGNPEAGTLSGGTLLSLFMGPTLSMKLWLYAMILSAALGAYALGKYYGLTPLAAMWPALVFVLSGFVAYRVTTATMFVVGAGLLPWLILLYLVSLRRTAWIIGCAAVAMVAIGAGDTHVVAYGVVALAIMSCWYSVTSRSIRPLGLLLIFGTLVCLFSAVKILPVLEGQTHYHKNLASLVVLLSKHHALADVFLSPSLQHDALRTEHGNPEGWENIGLYTGALTFVLGALGFFVAPRRFWFIGLLIGGMFLVIGEGTFFENVIRHVHGFSSLFRLPTRSLVVFVLFLGIAGGYPLVWLPKRWGKKGAVLAMALLVLVGIDLSMFTIKALHRVEEIPPVSVPYAPDASVAAMNMHVSADYPLAVLASHAAIDGTCPDFNVTPPFARTGYVGPLVRDAGGMPPPAILTSRGVTVGPVAGPAVLSVHLAYSPLLTVTGGFVYPVADGSFMIFVPQATSVVSIAYTSPTIRSGLLVTVTSLIAWALAAFYAARTRSA